jgi:hypothetical protein
VSTFVVVRSRVLPAKVFPSQNLKFGFFLTPVEIEIQTSSWSSYWLELYKENLVSIEPSRTRKGEIQIRMQLPLVACARKILAPFRPHRSAHTPRSCVPFELGNGQTVLGNIAPRASKPKSWRGGQTFFFIDGGAIRSHRSQFRAPQNLKRSSSEGILRRGLPGKGGRDRSTCP